MKYNIPLKLMCSALVALIVGSIVKLSFNNTITYIDNLTAVAFALLTFTVLTLFAGGSLSPFAFKRNLERIGVTNRNGQAPFLLSIRKGGCSPNGFVISILNRGVSIDDFERVRENIESSFNIIIDKIKNPDGSRRITQIFAVPASCDLPSYIPFEKGRMSDNPYKIALGQGLTGMVAWDYTSQIHALIAGTTGSGKSALVRLIIHSLLQHSNHNSVYVLDFKGVDYAAPYYQNKAEIIYDENAFLSTLREQTAEMHARLAELRRCNCKNINEYNAGIHNTWKHIFIIIDEASELFSKRDDPTSKGTIREILSELTSICRLGRAAGIHVVIATQRPSSESVPGVLRACIDAKICGKVTSDTESIIVLDNASAVKRIREPIPGRFLFNDTLFQAFYFDDSYVEV